MFLLRIGSKGKWSGQADDLEAVQKAAGDLQLRGNEPGLSVFSLDATAESQEMAARFALTNQQGTDHIDCIVFEESLAGELGLDVVATTNDRLDPTLSSRHREVRGLTPELSERLARAILASPHRIVDRVPRGEVARLGVELCLVDPELRRRLKPDWEARIAPLLG